VRAAPSKKCYPNPVKFAVSGRAEARPIQCADQDQVWQGRGAVLAEVPRAKCSFVGIRVWVGPLCEAVSLI